MPALPQLATLAAATVAVALPAAAIPAQAVGTPTAPSFRGISHACPGNEEGVYETPFTDVVLFDAAIHCVWKWDLTNGTTPTTYSPFASVTRAQMASFVARLIREAGSDLPDGDDAFVDDESSAHEADINALAAAGIAWGTGPDTYSTSQNVTRAQMAAFLIRSYHYFSRQDIATGNDYFADDDGHPLEGDVNLAAEVGFAGGNADGTYRPQEPVRRDHMALFLARWLDKAVDDELTEVPFPMYP